MRHRYPMVFLILSLLPIVFTTAPAAADPPDAVVVPRIEGPWWQVAGDGTWQLWSCIRKTNCGGNTRLFHGCEGRRLTDTDWKPLGIVMQADRRFGESPASNHRGVNYCGISTDLLSWGPSKVIAEGCVYGKGPYCAECPHVVYHPQWKCYYLFNTQRYGRRQHTTVFRSTDPFDFGINDNRCEVTTLPVAAPEIILHEGRYYIASLMPSLKGIQIAGLKWVPGMR